MNRAMRFAFFVLLTCFSFSGVSRTALAPSSIYPSLPAVLVVGKDTSVSKASPKGIESSSLSGSGRRSWRGGLNELGSHDSRSISSSARSNVNSETWEKMDGAGEDPKGSLFRIVPILFSSFSNGEP